MYSLESEVAYGAEPKNECVSLVFVKCTLSLHIQKCIITPLKPTCSLRKDIFHRKLKTNLYENAI